MLKLINVTFNILGMSEFLPKTVVCLREKYRWQRFRQDLLAGITVGIIALPAAMAFAIASGVSPERGLYTAIIAGFLISLLGGSRVQIGGPTGAFIVIIYGVVQRQGYDGLVLATLLAAGMLVIMGLCRLGNLVKYFPPALITGFTSGVAVGVFSAQIKDFLGLPLGSVPTHFIDKWRAYLSHLSGIHLTTCVLGVSSFLLMLLMRRFFKKLPGGVTIVILVTLFCALLGVEVETIGSRFGELPASLPIPSLPACDLRRLCSLIPDALVIALLAGVESLLSAVVADRMSGGKHRSNCELIAQGIANGASVIFGGIPATGAIARTAINVESGAKTPFAGMIHSVVLLLLLLFLAPLVTYIPLAALSAVLVMVAWNMSEAHDFCARLKGSWQEMLVLLTTFLLTVFVDLVVGISGGMAMYGIVRKWKQPVALK